MYVRAYAQIQQPIIGVSYLNSLEWDVKQQTCVPRRHLYVCLLNSCRIIYQTFSTSYRYMFSTVSSRSPPFTSYCSMCTRVCLHPLRLILCRAGVHASLHFVQCCVGITPPFCTILRRYASLHFVLSQCFQECLLPFYYVEGSRAGMLQLQIINNRKKCNETIQKSKKKIMNKFVKIKIYKIVTPFPLKMSGSAPGYIWDTTNTFYPKVALHSQICLRPQIF